MYTDLNTVLSVGCYDGQLYVFHADTGSPHWVFSTSPSNHDEGKPLPIKSSPCVSPTTGYVWFGSHDHYMYAVNVQTKSLAHKVYLGGGSCFASPCVDASGRVVYGATLRGRITALNNVSGQIEWMYQCPRPVFSSLTNYIVMATDQNVVLVGCADGMVYALGQDGKLIATLTTGNAVFSSPCVVTSAEGRVWIMCGSHDNHVHCWNGKYEQEWKLQLDSEVYSTPCPLTLETTPIKHTPSKASTPPRRSERNYTKSQIDRKRPATNAEGAESLSTVVVCSSAGCVYIVDVVSGGVMGSYSLPGAVFSSPACFEQSVVVGCRDDFVYCIDLNVT